MYNINFVAQLSWSKVNLFLQCHRCFYKEQVLGKKRPNFDPDSFSLNNAVDTLWKKEFDHYREQQAPHPLMTKHNINAVPLAHALLNQWRNYRVGGIRVVDSINNLELCGIIDDVWVNQQQEFIIVDYKATAKEQVLNLTNKWNLNNKLQLSFYANLLKRSGYKVHSTGYFVYSIALKDKLSFDQQLDFETTVQACSVDDSWVEETAIEIRKCLSRKNLPPSTGNCDFCKFDLQQT